MRPSTFVWIVAVCLSLTLAASIDYNADVSRRMRTYSLIAHCTQDQIVNWHCKLCSQTEQLKDLQYIENKPTQIMAFGGYMESIDKIVFTFRGTINATNWIEDFAFQQIPYRKCTNCKVHEGFYLSYMSVANQVHNAVNTLRQKYPTKDIVITGCSLGGALATIAAIEIHTQGEKISELHTYGSPRVGNADFAMYVKTRLPNSLRVVHNRDIVPHVPLLSQNYHHIPFEILFDEEMRKYQICNDGGEDPSCSNSYYPNYLVQDHLSYWIKLDVAEICAEAQLI